MKYRMAVVLPMYVAIYAIAFYAAFLLRFDFKPGDKYNGMYLAYAPYVVAFKLAVVLISAEWLRSFRYATLIDIASVFVGAAVSAAAVYGANLSIFGAEMIPRSVILIDCALTIILSSLMRCGYRFTTEFLDACRFTGKDRLRTLIYRANEDGAGILRTLQATRTDFRVVGFVEPEAAPTRERFCGIPRYALNGDWSQLARRKRATHVLLPSSMSGQAVRETVRQCAAAGLKTHIIPSVSEIVAGRYTLSIRDVTISDLLRREPARLDMDSIARFVREKRVLVTGGAGSIGSELCRQILSFQPHSLVLVDQSETGVFQIGAELQESFPYAAISLVVADVTDRDTMARILQKHRPQQMFHAAAYKHVPLMEDHPQEAVRNNVFGTKTVADLAEEYGVERFVLISTDKAVNPSSVMGATKFLAERYLQALSAASKTGFMMVRFGNVLNSAGSVVPTFRRQIEAGGPVTVTHPDMVRYFMTIPEAAQLVLQAGAIGTPGDVLILDMGEPVRIADLARDMILLSGLKYPDDIEIVYTGIRPGEKLSEELFYTVDQSVRKVHDKIFGVNHREKSPAALAAIRSEFAELAQSIRGSSVEAREALLNLVERHVARVENSEPAAVRKAA